MTSAKGKNMAHTISMRNLDEGIVEVILDRAERRNALSEEMIRELTASFEEIGRSDARGVILGAEGTVFCAGHDFADMVGKSYVEMKGLLERCTQMMQTIHRLPQPVLARVQGLATGAGCQLALTCDLVVASETGAFETPGGRGGWFCTTPMVALTRALGTKRALEMLLTGDRIEARTAYDWGMINRVVTPADLEHEARALLLRATRGSRLSKGIGKQTFYRQVGLDEVNAYNVAVEVMAAAATTEAAREGMAAFVAKRAPKFD
jgi:enoyl-CoA hydratase/carnithine racemase